MSDVIESAEKEYTDAKQWEEELENQLEAARVATRTAKERLERLQGLREDFILPEGAVPPDKPVGHLIQYRFTIHGRTTERAERMQETSRSEALVQFWNATPFSRLAQQVQVISLSPIIGE